MKRIVKPFLLTISTIFLLLIIIYIFFSIKWKLDSTKNFDLLGDKAPIINVGGNSLRDLNKNGRLDPYENPNNTIEERVEDLVNQMTIEEKAGSFIKKLFGDKSVAVIGLTQSYTMIHNVLYRLYYIIHTKIYRLH